MACKKCDNNNRFFNINYVCEVCGERGCEDCTSIKYNGLKKETETIEEMVEALNKVYVSACKGDCEEIWKIT